MTTVSQATLAEEIARTAHGDALKRGVRPMIEHVEGVVARCDPRDAPVAWLHDVIEHSSLTAEQLHEAGVDDDVIAVVVALSRGAHESHEAYWARVKAAGPVALRVKAADLDDNSAPDSLALLDADTQARLRQRYASARAFLGLPDGD